MVATLWHTCIDTDLGHSPSLSGSVQAGAEHQRERTRGTAKLVRRYHPHFSLARFGDRCQHPCLPPLRSFTANEKFPLQEGFEDHLDLDLGWWTVRSKDELGMDDFRRHLAGPPEGKEHLAFETNTPRYSQIFLRPKAKGKDRNQLKIRSKKLIWDCGTRELRPTLFKGWLNLLQAESNFQKNLSLRLNLNLPRFIRHQPQSILPPGVGKPTMRQRMGERNSYGNEFAFDGRDNWIPNVKAWHDFSHFEERAKHLKDYLKGIMAIVGNDFDRACQNASEKSGVKMLPRVQYHALRHVEIAWEFSSPNAIEDVTYWGIRLLNLRKASGECRFAKYKMAGRVLNSPCFHIPLQGDTFLSLYAKTNQRIRFEVVFRNVGKIRTELLEEADVVPYNKDAAIRGMTLRPDYELYDTIEGCRKRASDLLRVLMADCRAKYSDRTRPFEAMEFLALVAGTVPQSDDETARVDLLKSVFSMLLFGEGFYIKIPPGSFGDAIKALKKCGVLTWVQKRQSYAIGKKYQSAVNALRTLRNEPALALLGRSIGTRGVRDRKHPSEEEGKKHHSSIKTNDAMAKKKARLAAIRDR